MSVSVIIPAYNAEATIERAVATVLNQTSAPLEVIVVDDASTDGTRDVLRRMIEADPRVKLLENPVNRGPSGSRNRGLQGRGRRVGRNPGRGRCLVRDPP